MCVVQLTVLGATPLLAQSDRASITGRIVDAQGALMAGVDVVARNNETGNASKGISNESGIYLLPALSPGPYSLTATYRGFKTYERSGITLATSQEITLDIQMEIGNVSQVINVSAQAPLLETTGGALGQTIDNRSIDALPLLGRRATQLVKLSANALFIPAANPTKPGFAIGGGRPWDQNYWLDGGSNQNIRIGAAQIDTDPPVEVIREFKVLTNNYSPEFGGTLGGVIVTTTKSGTNQFHGSAYEYVRNDALTRAW
jgi:hypothetical protein